MWVFVIKCFDLILRLVQDYLFVQLMFIKIIYVGLCLKLKNILSYYMIKVKEYCYVKSIKIIDNF